MENENKKKTNAPIDEAYIMSIMAGETKKPEKATEEPQAEQKELIDEKPASKERTRQKKVSGFSYGERFLNGHTMTRRGDKSIYIRQEYHERLPVLYRLSVRIKYPCMLIWTIFSNTILNSLRKPSPMILMRNLNPYFKVFDYGNNNCYLPADCYCAAGKG